MNIADRSAPVSRLHVTVAALVVTLMIATGLIIWRHQADIAQRRAKAQAQLDALTKQERRIGDLESRYSKIIVAFDRTKDDALTAGNKRHDSRNNYDTMKIEAKRELADVDALQGLLASERSSLDDIASAYANVLGQRSVSGFQASADRYIQTEDLGLNRWGRAIQDITDAIVNDTYVSGNVEQLYLEDSDYETRAVTINQEMGRQWTNLQNQVKSRVEQARSALTAIK